jgi:HAD superfamily hydrolase (TIGR01548 family)
LCPAGKVRVKRGFPEVIIFDMDGVLVDVRGSFLRTTLDTVRHFTGKRVTMAQLFQWKNRSGFNDDWITSHAWVRALGGRQSFAEVKKKYQELYWGQNSDGNVNRERWLLPPAALRRLATRAEVSVFTGRTYQELNYTLDRFKLRDLFHRIVTVEDVKKGKPDPEGLFQILHGRSPDRAVYIGDNVDDARAARSAAMPFLGILPKGSEARKQGKTQLLELGALHVLGNITDIESWLARATIWNRP